VGVNLPELVPIFSHLMTWIRMRESFNSAPLYTQGQLDHPFMEPGSSLSCPQERASFIAHVITNSRSNSAAQCNVSYHAGLLR
jgi:hypothetical protein